MGGFLNFILIGLGSFFSMPSEGMVTENDSLNIPVYSFVTKSQSIEITDGYEIINSQKINITVLHAEGLKHAQIIIPYDDLTEIESFNGTVRNPLTGKTIQKLRLKDLNDRSWISDFSVFEDNRLKYLSIHSGSFPVEVSYQVSTKTKGNFNIPSWHPAPYAYQKVVAATLEVLYPKDKGIRYLPVNLTTESTELDTMGKAMLRWKEDNLEPYAHDFSEEDKAVLRLAPHRFSMEGYSSTMEDWQGLGKWINLLNRDKEVLPEEAKQLVAQLTAGLEAEQEKVAALYQYLQDNYRYVSIQLGIGGWMPMAAREVYQLKYGDCKALTILMKAMLKEAGINSYYSLIKAGSTENDIAVDFPSNQFNHVILQVPSSDTLWLECTSRILPAGFLGDFTMNRTALVIDEDGGSLQRTPDYQPLQYNRYKSQSEIVLLENGEAEMSQSLGFEGFGAMPFLQMDFQNNQNEIQKQLYTHLYVPGGLYMNHFDLKVIKENSIPAALLNHHSHLEKFYQSTAKRIMITPNLKQISPDEIPNRNMLLEEAILIKTPSGLEGENLSPVSLQDSLFDYDRQVSYVNDQLIINRILTLHFPADTTKEAISQALAQIRKLDLQPILLKKLN